METAFRILSDFVLTLRADGHNISHIDFGGGLGIPYHADREAPPLPSAYAAMVKRVTHNLGCTLMFEPGRMIVGNAGILVARVIYVKPGDAKNFVIIDAAMNDLIRPTLYEAHHDILPVREAGQAARARSPPMWSGRSARPAITSRSTATARTEARRSPRDHDRRRLWRGAVRLLQHARAGAGSAGQGRPVRRGAPAHRGRGTDRDGPAGAVAVIKAILPISKEFPMRILALAILTIATFSANSPGHAQTYNPRYPVCLKVVENFGSERIECAFTSLEQCAPSAAGRAGQCIANPFYAGAGDRRYRRAY